MKKSTKLREYEGKGDPDEHVQLVNDWMNYFSTDKASKCKLFALTLVGPSKMWRNGLSDGSIESWVDFYEWFFVHFTSRKKQLLTIDFLSGIIQGKEKSLWSYINCFMQVDVEVQGAKEGMN